MAINHSDGIIIGSKEINSEVEKYIKQSDKINILNKINIFI